MVIRRTYTFQRRIHVDSTSTSTLRLVRWIFYVDSTSKSICADMVCFSTSNQRQFYVEKYLCRHGIFFIVDSTLKFLSTRTVDSSTSNKSIPRRCFPHGIRRFFDVEYVGDVEVPDDVPLTFLSTLHQRCKLKNNKGEWIYQVK